MTASQASTLSAPSVLTTLPESFVSQMETLLGDEAPAFFDALNAPVPTSIRFNPGKVSTTGESLKLNLHPIPWAAQGYYLSERPSFTGDPLFHAGAYYVQEASSMKLESLIKNLLNEGETSEAFAHLKDVKFSHMDKLCVLDLCAAPGGKSTHLASLLPTDTCLVSNEYIKNRALVLRDNLTKWGFPNQIVCNNAPKEIGKCFNAFDLIVADVPCSGEGMFRKDPDAIREWSPQAVLMCAQRQKEIIQNVWSALKPGGYLIYSTCTYNRAENEDNLAWICTELGAKIYHQEHCYPHRTLGEGFFISLLQKNDEDTTNGRTTKSKNTLIPVPKSFESVKSYLKYPEEYRFHFREPDIIAIPESILPAYEMLRPHLHILCAGIKLGEIKGKDFIPDYALALSTALQRNTLLNGVTAPAHFSTYECSLDEALQYLRMDSFCAKDIPNGYALVCFQNLPLGWIKHLGTRSNNLLPKELRIRNIKPKSNNFQ